MRLFVWRFSLLIFFLLSAENNSFIATTAVTNLHSILQKASGVYTNVNRQSGFEHTVLVTGCNYGFLNHLYNFKCFADRLGLKFLVVAMDPKAYQHLTNQTNMFVYYMPIGSDNTSESVTSDSVTFRSKQFNLITQRKKEVVHDILALGYDVLFTDTDVAIIEDPIKIISLKNVDYVHSLNAVCTR